MARRTPYPFPEGARAGKGQLAFDQLTCEPSNMEVREQLQTITPKTGTLPRLLALIQDAKQNTC